MKFASSGFPYGDLKAEELNQNLRALRYLLAALAELKVGIRKRYIGTYGGCKSYIYIFFSSGKK